MKVIFSCTSTIITIRHILCFKVLRFGGHFLIEFIEKAKYLGYEFDEVGSDVYRLRFIYCSIFLKIKKGENEDEAQTQEIICFLLQCRKQMFIVCCGVELGGVHPRYPLLLFCVSPGEGRGPGALESFPSYKRT